MAIGPAGRLARNGVGLIFFYLALFWREPQWQDFALGLVVMPTLVIVGALAWRRHSAGPLRATGAIGHVLNLAVFLPLFFLPATAGAAFVFYGTAMVVAAARRSPGCEVTAISNALLRRDDQVGCALYLPIDAAEAGVRRVGGTASVNR